MALFTFWKGSNSAARHKHVWIQLLKKAFTTVLPECLLLILSILDMCHALANTKAYTKIINGMDINGQLPAKWASIKCAMFCDEKNTQSMSTRPIVTLDIVLDDGWTTIIRWSCPWQSDASGRTTRTSQVGRSSRCSLACGVTLVFCGMHPGKNTRFRGKKDVATCNFQLEQSTEWQEKLGIWTQDPIAILVGFREASD